jgi:hypothetical protein
MPVIDARRTAVIVGLQERGGRPEMSGKRSDHDAETVSECRSRRELRNDQKWN